MDDLSKYADMREASDITGLGRQRLYGLIMSGDLTPTKFFNRNFFLREDLVEFAEKRQRYGKTKRQAILT